MNICGSRKKFFLSFAFVIFFSHMALAVQFIKITKSNSVIAYRDASRQSKILGIFSAGNEAEIVSEDPDWFKIKIRQQKDYYIFGWVVKKSPYIQVIQKTVPAPAKPGKTTVSSKNSDEVDDEKETSEEIEDNEDVGNHNLKFFVGPVYSLHKYGAFQTEFGLSYEFPVSDEFTLGIPIGYATGDSFGVFRAGVDGIHTMKFGKFLVGPRIGAGFEYLFGNGEAFNALSLEVGATIDYTISSHFLVGLEPFAADLMVWNSTDSLNKVPFNVRGESMILIRGRW